MIGSNLLLYPYRCQFEGPYTITFDLGQPWRLVAECMCCLLNRSKETFTPNWLMNLYRSDVGDHRVCIVAVEPKHRHVFMAREQTLANSSRELAQIGPGIQDAEARGGGMGAVTAYLNGTAAAAQALGDYLATLLHSLRLTSH
jgi:hypothetical protein